MPEHKSRMPAAQRRTALVEAATRVVAARGVSAATTRAIVAEAGMSLASFHYAFTSRDELMGEVITFAVGREAGALQPIMTVNESDLSMRDTLRAGLQDYFSSVTEDPLREKAMFELTQYAMRTRGMAELARQQYAQYYELAASALVVAAEKTRMTWARPVGEIAPLLVALTDGLTIAWLVNRDDRAAEAIIDFAADAVAALAVPSREVPQRPVPRRESRAA